nr:hypothetical protein [Tanacetum cinerariifolium]
MLFYESFLKYAYSTSNVLSAQWDRCNVMVLTWIMNSVSRDVYMGLVYSNNCVDVWKELQETYDKVDGSVVYNLLQKINIVKQGVNNYLCIRKFLKLVQFLMGLDECYQPVRSALLTRDPLPDVKGAYNIVFRDESHRWIPESFGVSETKMNATSFVVKSFNNNRRNFNTNNNTRGTVPNVMDVKSDKQNFVSPSSSKFTPKQIKKLLHLINDNGSGNFHANMAGANQHLTISTVGMFSVVDVSSLKITVGHPNGTLATISHIGNLKLTNNMVLYDVLMDLTRQRILGTGSEFGAMNNEIEALNRNNTWTICDLPPGSKPTGYKWLFKMKYKASGDIESPVIKMVTIRCLISIVVKMNWQLYQLDVNNAFLYGELVEDVYMTLPQGFDKDNGFKSKFDYSLYVNSEGSTFVALLVYVDDIVITRNDESGPDISYDVHCLNQHMHGPLQSHFKAALRVLRYLKQENVAAGIIKTVKVHTDDQIADIITKCLGIVQHNLFCRNHGMKDLFVVKIDDKVQDRVKLVEIRSSKVSDSKT